MGKKMKEYGLPRPAAQNLITIKECCSFQHFGEKEYRSHVHVVTIYSGSVDLYESEYISKLPYVIHPNY